MRINDLLIKLSTLDDLGKISWIMEKDIAIKIEPIL